MDFIRYRNTLVYPTDTLTRRPIRGGGYVVAGYPAEAYNYIEPELDLNKKIIRNRDHNRCVWATNVRMTGEGIFFGDMVVIDKALKWKPDAVGLYLIDGEFALCREVRRNDGVELVSINTQVKPEYVASGETLERKGIVTHIVKKYAVYGNNYAGLPDNIETYVEQGVDYNKYLIDEGHEAVTFYLWAWGDSMTGDGIEQGDLLITDNTAPLHDDSIQVFIIDGYFTLKRVVNRGDYMELVSSNPQMPPIRIRKGEELQRWGILTGVVKPIYSKKSNVIPSF